MLESKCFTITILICACVRLTEQGLVMRPTRAFEDAQDMGRREHLMTKSYGNINSMLPGASGQVPGLLQKRRPFVGRPKIGIGQHLPRLPHGYTQRSRPQQRRPQAPRNIFRQNNPDLTTSTVGPVMRQRHQKPETPDHRKPEDNEDPPRPQPPPPMNDDVIPKPPQSRNDTNADDEVDNQNQPNNHNMLKEPENYISRLYEGPSTRSTSPMYAPGQEPQHGYTDKALQEKCKNAQCNPVAWQDVEELT